MARSSQQGSTRQPTQPPRGCFRRCQTSRRASPFDRDSASSRRGSAASTRISLTFSRYHDTLLSPPRLSQPDAFPTKWEMRDRYTGALTARNTKGASSICHDANPSAFSGAGAQACQGRPASLSRVSPVPSTSNQPGRNCSCALQDLTTRDQILSLDRSLARQSRASMRARRRLRSEQTWRGSKFRKRTAPRHAHVRYGN